MRGLAMVPVEKGASTERKVESLYTALSDAKEYPIFFPSRKEPKEIISGKNLA
jgi:hypothetical protein